MAYLLGNTSLPMRVELVAFTLEEPLGPGERGVFRTHYGGSAVHADSLKRQGIPVRIMFSLEMIGFFDDAEGSQDYPFSLLKLFYPSRGNFISVVGKLDQGWAVRRVKKAMRAASSLPVYSIQCPSICSGNRLVGPFQLLGSGLHGGHGYRHILPSEQALPHRKGYPGPFGL